MAVMETAVQSEGNILPCFIQPLNQNLAVQNQPPDQQRCSACHSFHPAGSSSRSIPLCQSAWCMSAGSALTVQCVLQFSAPNESLNGDLP